MSNFSFVQYTGDGSTGPFAVPFSYIEQSHVAVTVDGVSAAFTWTTGSSVTLSSSAASGAIVEIRRTTPRTVALVDFTDGSVLTEADLDLSALQSRYLVQEALDATANSATLASDGTLTAGTKRISNVVDPIGAQDAATKNYVDAQTGADQSAAAAASATAAQTAQTAAEAAQAAAEAVVVTSATESAPGIVELATTAEATTGTDTSRAVTPAGVAAAIAGELTAPAINTLLLDASGFSNNLATTDDTIQEIADKVDALSAGGVTLVGTTTVSSNVSSVTLTGLTATYTSYEIEILRMAFTSAGVDLRIQYSTDGGSTFLAGGYDYGRSLAGGNEGNASGSSYIDLGTAYAASVDNYSLIRLADPMNSSPTILRFIGTYYNTSGEMYSTSGSARRSTSEQVNAVRIYPSSGNISSALIKIRGLT